MVAQQTWRFVGWAALLLQAGAFVHHDLAGQCVSRRSSSSSTRRVVAMNVKTVSQTLRAFEKAYPRPIVTVWRGPITDMLQVTHLSIVDKRFKYDPIFGYGYMFIFNLLLDKYPVDGEKEKLIDASLTALDLNAATVRGDAVDVGAWAEGKTEADVLSAAETPGGGKINKALAEIKANEEYLHTRGGNFGFIQLIDAVGGRPDNSTLARWSEAFGLRKRSIEKDAVTFKELREKMNQAMQLVKSLEIREKKKMADQLEKKAKEAQERAEGASAAAADATKSSDDASSS